MAPTTTAPTKPEVMPRIDDGTGGGAGRGGGDFGGWTVPARTYHTGMWMALVAIMMLFAAFTSALVVRKGLGDDWVHTELPRILWLNTVVLIASSATLEFSRRSLKDGLTEQSKRWLYVTVFLGLFFVVGQLVAWRQLVLRGVYLASNPSSSFFYLLTATHGVHLLGGVAALFYLAVRAGRIGRKRLGQTAVGVTSLYWHFMDALWIYIFVLLARWA